MISISRVPWIFNRVWFDGLKNACSIDKMHLFLVVCFKVSNNFKSSCYGENLLSSISTFVLESHISFSKCFSKLRKRCDLLLNDQLSHTYALWFYGKIHCRIRISCRKTIQSIFLKDLGIGSCEGLPTRVKWGGGGLRDHTFLLKQSHFLLTVVPFYFNNKFIGIKSSKILKYLKTTAWGNT